MKQRVKDGKLDKFITQTPERKKRSSLVMKEWHKSNIHPRGFLGKNRSDQERKDISIRSIFAYKNLSKKRKGEKIMKMLKTKSDKGNLYPERHKTTWKSGWREIGGVRKYYRSRWEANYARYLQLLKESGNILNWEHEPHTFWFESIKRGCRSYLPDFRVYENSGEIVFHEVKGWMDDRSKTKIKRMKKYYPEVKLKLIQAAFFKLNSDKLKGLIKDWE